jgi:hypothetical protein
MGPEPVYFLFLTFSCLNFVKCCHPQNVMDWLPFRRFFSQIDLANLNQHQQYNSLSRILFQELIIPGGIKIAQ